MGKWKPVPLSSHCRLCMGPRFAIANPSAIVLCYNITGKITVRKLTYCTYFLINICILPTFWRFKNNFDYIVENLEYVSVRCWSLIAINVKKIVYLQVIGEMTHRKRKKIMNGGITLAALCHCQRASKIISPFIILPFSMCHFAVITCR